MEFFKSKLFRFIASLGLAALFYFLCPPCFNKMYLGAVLLLLVLIINLPKIFGYKWLTQLCRLAVGGLFIFSGFIKANDPIGFSIKLNEYFDVFESGFSCDMKLPESSFNKIPCEAEHQENLSKRKYEDLIVKADAKFNDSLWADAKSLYMQAGAMLPSEQYPKDQVKACNDKLGISNGEIAEQKEMTGMQKFWHFFADHSLFLAIFICGFEIVVGIFLLLGLWPRWTLLLLLAMIVFFSFLTFYSACCNKVTSCGCFGDAIKLTPWESFWKDLILLILIAAIFVGEQHIKPLFKNRILLAGIAGIGIFLSFAFPLYTWRHLPILDFRPYKVGTNIYEAMHPKDPKKTGCQNDSILVIYYYQNIRTGKIVHFYAHNKDSMNLITGDSLMDYYCRQDIIVRKGTCNPTIADFNLNDPESGENLNDSLLHNLKGPQFFLVMEDLALADREAMPRINSFYNDCKAHNVPFNGLSNVSGDQVTAFRNETGAKFPMLEVDGTALKTVIRSNPGLVMLNNGVVVAMWHWHDIPDFNDAMQKLK